MCNSNSIVINDINTSEEIRELFVFAIKYRYADTAIQVVELAESLGCIGALGDLLYSPQLANAANLPILLTKYRRRNNA